MAYAGLVGQIIAGTTHREDIRTNIFISITLSW